MNQQKSKQKRATGAKRGKTHASLVSFNSDWLKIPFKFDCEEKPTLLWLAEKQYVKT